MNSYEQSLSIARNPAVRVPEFASVAEVSERERQRWTEEGRDVRARARRWLLAGAAAWLSWSLIEAVEFNLGLGWIVFGMLSCLPPALCLAWAAYLSGDRKLRSGILVRAIAASNLVLALLISLSQPPFFASSAWLVILVVAVSSGRALQLLGERGLDGSEDPDSRFEPVKFRGILILALVMAATDALTLVYAAAVTGTSATLAYLTGGFENFAPLLPGVWLTVAAAALMAINVWGLLRLRTWALLSNMITNVAIAALALTGMLATAALTAGTQISIALAVTAGVQLLLPLPILAAGLGLGPTRSYERLGALLLRVAVPVLVLVTAGAVLLHMTGASLSAW